MNNEASGSVGLYGDFTKLRQPNGGGFTGSSAWMDYQFEIDTASTLLLEAANWTMSNVPNSSSAPIAPAWQLKNSRQAIVGSGGNALNSSDGWSIPVEAGSYTLRMNGAHSNNVAWGALFAAAAEFRTVYNWGIDALPGTVENPLLPTSIGLDDFVFDLVTTQNIRFYDPEIATGYDFSTSGTPFASVQVPTALPGGDSTFDLLIGADVFALNAGETFDFTSISAVGIRDFGIRGIDASEGLDPNNPTAFVTGLSFTEAGVFSNFQMTPVTSSTPSVVPEPSSLTIIGLGMCFLGFRTRRRKPRQSAVAA